LTAQQQPANKSPRNQNTCICIYIRMDTNEPLLPPLPCMCGSFRRAARALTHLYEQALRPLGLRGTQFTILQALALAGEITQGQLGKILAMDSTSLTRTLAIMLRQGWITARPGKDRRERHLRLATNGEKQLQKALPLWEEVQTRLRHQLSAPTWKNLLQLTQEVTRIAKIQGGSL
jgi:DNA-binding MarR family transcriptional regulator